MAERHAGISRPEAQGLLDGLLAHLMEVREVVDRSAISDPTLRQRYQALLDERACALGPAGIGGSEEEEEEED